MQHIIQQLRYLWSSLLKLICYNTTTISCSLGTSTTLKHRRATGQMLSNSRLSRKFLHWNVVIHYVIIIWLRQTWHVLCADLSFFHNLEEGYSVLPISLVIGAFFSPMLCIHLYPWKNNFSKSVMIRKWIGYNYFNYLNSLSLVSKFENLEHLISMRDINNSYL